MKPGGSVPHSQRASYNPYLSQINPISYTVNIKGKPGKVK
jgi:hypothetical protein